jgi:hypothetical protein
MPLYLCDNEFVKFEHDGKRYCLHLHYDDVADDPRSWDEPITTMACFLRRHKLGDDIGTSDPRSSGRASSQPSFRMRNWSRPSRTERFPE